MGISCECMIAPVCERGGNTELQPDGSNPVQTGPPVTISVGVQVCPAFTPPFTSAAEKQPLAHKEMKT